LDAINLGTHYNASVLIPIVQALAALVAVALSGAPLAQTGASRVALAAVVDARNRPVVDLGPDDFVIEETGKPREILSVRPADYPIVVLLDNGAEGRADFPGMRKAVAHFIDRIGQRPVAVGTFGNPLTMIATFDDDRGEVMKRLNALESSNLAGSLLLEGASLAGRTLQAAGSMFSAIVVVSATSIDASRDAPVELLAPIIDSSAILHLVSNRVAEASSGRPGPDVALRALAEQTHGEFTTIYSPASYQAALDRLADRLTSELMVEYLVPVGSKPSDVKVGVRLAGTRVRGLGVAPR
jgi:hypothetical protein